MAARSNHAPRIAFVTGGLKLGGSTTFLCNLAGELIRQNIPSIVLSFESETPLRSDFEAQSIPMTCQDEQRSIYEDRMLATLQEIVKFEPTVVVANLSAISFEVLRYLPSGVFRVGVSHSDELGVYETIRRYSQHLDAIMVVSQTIKTKLETLAELQRIPIIYAPLGVPMPAGPVMDKGYDERRLKILYYGRLDREQKRVHLFPQIYAQLKASGRPFEWTIAGDGPARPWLQGNMGASSTTQKLVFSGKVAYAEVPGLLARHDIFLLTSDYEGLPLSLLEAMGHGLVPVVSDLPSGVRELISDATGMLVNPDDVDGYARAILWLDANRGEMRRRSQNARETVWHDFSIGKMADRWLAVFSKAPGRDGSWPRHWKVQPPLGTSNCLAFSWAGRVIRRMTLGFRR